MTRVPEAQDACPRDVRPIPDPYRGRALEVGYLLDAAAAGKLPERTHHLTRKLHEEMKVRLGVRAGPGLRADLRRADLPHDDRAAAHPAPEGHGAAIHDRRRHPDNAGRQAALQGRRLPTNAGTDLRIVLSDLDLEILPHGRGGKTFRLCREA